MIFEMRQVLILNGDVVKDGIFYQREDSQQAIEANAQTWNRKMTRMGYTSYTWEILQSWQDGDLAGEVLLTQQKNRLDSYDD